MPSRGPYQHKILPIEETALERTVPPELRKDFHDLLGSAWKEEAGATEKRRPQLDALLDRFCRKARCQIPGIFWACRTTVVIAMVDRGREDARKKGRDAMDRQNKLRQRLNKLHREFQRVLKQPTFSALAESVEEAQQRSAAFVDTLSILSLTVSPPRLPDTGRGYA